MAAERSACWPLSRVHARALEHPYGDQAGLERRCRRALEPDEPSPCSPSLKERALGFVGLSPNVPSSEARVFV